MPRISLPEGASIHCTVDDFLWPWDASTPVLMMHGFARNAMFWNRWVPAIAETRRVYRPDLLGCGLSDQPPDGYRYTPETIGAQILAVLDGLSLPRVHWVGKSSGGIIGLLLAASYPDRVASLVLCNTPSRIPDRIKRSTRWIGPPPPTRCAPTVSANGAGRHSAIDSTWSMRARTVRLGRARDGPDPAGCRRRDARLLRGRRYRAAAAAHNAPVLLLSGDKSPIASAQQKTFAETLPNGRVELFAGVGHGVNLLRPERCARAAVEFWQTL